MQQQQTNKQIFKISPFYNFEFTGSDDIFVFKSCRNSVTMVTDNKDIKIDACNYSNFLSKLLDKPKMVIFILREKMLFCFHLLLQHAKRFLITYRLS